MKTQLPKSSLLILLSLFLHCQLQATTITVSNDPNRTAQFTSIQTAIDDVNTAIGDTILVYGSSNSYGSVNIYKTLVLVGEGYFNNGNAPAGISNLTISRFNATISGSNSTVLGFNIGNLYFRANFSNSTDESRFIENVSVLRCSINAIDFNQGSVSTTFNNINIINVIITNVVDLYIANQGPRVEDITFSNCIFDGARINSTLQRNEFGELDYWESLFNVKFYNNLFLNSTSGLLARTVGLVFENNIFFGHELYYNDYAQITWNNNLFYLIDHSPLGTNDNTGSGNLEATDPMFVTFPSTGAGFSYDHDYHLKAGSPALTASLGGGEIGIYGGAYPFEVGANPPVPVVTEVTIPDGTSSVPAGGTINFNFKAKSGN